MATRRTHSTARDKTRRQDQGATFWRSAALSKTGCVMGWVSFEARQEPRSARWSALRYGVVGLSAAATALVFTSDTALARHHHVAHSGHHHATAEEYSPP